MPKLALLLAALTVACSSASPEPVATTGGESTDDVSSDDFAVALVSAGEGERALLRYHVAPGLTASATARIEMTMRTRIDGTEGPPQTMPAMLLTYTIETTERIGDGIRYRFRYDDLSFTLGSDPAVDAAMSSMLAPLQRATGEAIVDARGRVTALRVEVPDDLSPELRSIVSQLEDMMRQIVAPLPEEPVAVGAVWTHESPVRASSGLAMLQRATYRLVARDGERVELAVETEVHAQPGPIPGAEGAMLVSLTGGGVGTSVLMLDGVVPASASMAVQLAQEATLSRGAQTLPMHLDVAMRIETAAR